MFPGSGNVACDKLPNLEDKLRLEKSVGLERHSFCILSAVDDVEVVLSLIRVVVVEVDSGPAANDVVDVRPAAMRACFLNGPIPNEMARRSILQAMWCPRRVTPLSSNG